MSWLLLLVATMVTVALAAAASVKEDPKVLAQRLVETEQECNHLKNLAGVKTEYSVLLKACEESLLLGSYAYMDQNHVSLDTNQKRFVVITSKGEETVKKPPQLPDQELQAMLKKYNEKNVLVEKSSSEQAQEIVSQQVLCEMQKSTVEDECAKKLNCLKDKFMADQHLDLKDNLQTFPIVYKGKEVVISSPPDADRTQLCQSSVTATSRGGHTADKGGRDNENEFFELDNLAKQSAKVKEGGNKMVTKALGDPNPMGLMMSALSSGLTGQGGGDLTKQMMGMAAPHIGGMLTNSLIGKLGKNTPLAMMSSRHINTLMKLAKNGFKSKANREKISKVELKQAVEIISKTAVHFTILALKVRSTVKDEAAEKRKKGFGRFIETLEVAILDALAASVVDYIVDMMLPDEEEPLLVTTAAPPAGGFLSSLSNVVGLLASPAKAAAPVKAPVAAPVAAPAASTDGESPIANLIKVLAPQLISVLTNIAVPKQ